MGNVLRQKNNLVLRALIASILVGALIFCFVPLSGCSANHTDSDSTVRIVLKAPRTSNKVVFDESMTQIDQVLDKMADSFDENYADERVDIVVEVFEQTQYDNAITDAFETADAPDILYGDYFNISTYVHTGRVVPLDDIVTDSMYEDIYPEMWDASSFGGHYYMLPYLARQNVYTYNKDLFKQAGLDEYISDGEIQSWTLEEWTRILDALAQKLPEATYPMMMYAKSSQGDTHIMTLLRSCGSTFFDESGHFNLSTPEGIAALRWIQDGVGRGWFPPHSENLEIEDCSRLFDSGQLAIYRLNNASLSADEDDVGLMNSPSPDGNGYATSFVSGFQVFDNGDPKKVQIAKDFLEYVYSNEELMSFSAGSMPASKSVAAKYGDAIPYFEAFSNNTDHLVDFTGSNPDTRAVRNIFYLCMQDLLTGDATPEQTAARLDRECNAAIDAGIASSQLHE